MQTNSFSWLHLTDLHFGLSGQNSLWPNLRQPFLDDLAELHRLSGPWQVVLFTGDLVQQGKSAEFAAMQKEVLERLWARLAELGSGDAVLLAVPGNHDLYRPDPKQDNPAVDTLLAPTRFKDIAPKFWDHHAGAYRMVVKDAFAPYEEWWRAVPQRAKGITSGILPGDFACTLPCGEHRIGIVGLNTAFLQLSGGDYHGKLVWDTRQLQAVCGGAADDWLAQHDLCLLLTHQGPDWLTPEARLHGATEIAPPGRFAAHLFGHMHETDIRIIQTGGNPDAVRLLQGSSVFGMEMFGEPPRLTRTHGYSAGRITFEEGKASLRIWPRIATNRTGPWRFIPDYDHAALENDHGTAPVGLQPRMRKTAKPNSSQLPQIVRPTMQSEPNAFLFERGYLHDKFIPQNMGPHSNLPTRRPFFGRTSELASIATWLQPSFVGWGVVLDGPGGIGKTALALEAAHRAPAENFPLKVFVSAKQTRLDPDGEHRIQDNRADNFFELLTQIGLALGRGEVQSTTEDKLPELIRHALTTQRTLLVLDNLEHFGKEERRRIYDLLEELPSGCRAIVTSRRSENTMARTLRLDKLEFEAAQQLLHEMGERMPAVKNLSPEEQQTLYEETNGNPLLLRWVAAQLGLPQGRCKTLDDAVARLHHAHELGKHNPQNDPLEFIFGDLLDTFTENETAILAALSHFTVPAPLAWLLPMTQLSQTAAETALDDLRNRALLIEDDVNETWFLPPLCKHFLRLRRPEAIQASGERLADEIMAMALQHGGYHNAPYRELEAGWPRIEAALPSIINGNNTRLQEFCKVTHNFLAISGRWKINLELNLAGEKKALAVDDLYQAGKRTYIVGIIHATNDDGMAALATANKCMQYWEKAPANEVAFATRLRGIAYIALGDYLTAIKILTQAMELFQSIETNKTGIYIIHNDLAIAQKRMGDLNSAEANYQKALQLAEGNNDNEGIAIFTNNLAELAIKRNDWSTATQLATAALSVAKTLGFLPLIGSSHLHLTHALLGKGCATEALPHAREAVSIYTRIQDLDLPEAIATLEACEQANSGAFGELAREIAELENLATVDNTTHGAALATRLNQLSSLQMEHNQTSEATATAQRAIQVWQSLPEQIIVQHAHELANSLNLLLTLDAEQRPPVRLLDLAIRFIEANTSNHPQYPSWQPRLQASLRQQITASTQTLQLTRLNLKNYRGFEQIEIRLTPRLTVLVAENGHGKTAVLDACRIALWPFVECFDQGRSKGEWESGISLDDIHWHKMPDGDFARQIPAHITMTGHIGPEINTQWSRVREDDRPDTPTGDGNDSAWIRTWAQILQRQIRIPDQPILSLPVFAYYGTGRLWSRQSVIGNDKEFDGTVSDDDMYIRTFGYRDCLDSASSYHHFAEWFKWVSEAHFETQSRQAEQGLPLDTPTKWQDQIRMVRTAIDVLLKEATGWHTLTYSVSHEKSLILYNDLGDTMKVAQLSDGIRNMLAMIGDLAWRCIKLNPHLGTEAVVASTGVVLIDELDMHLHPGWQQRVADQLMEAFPKIQFIVTTHSPQVLSSVVASSIRVLHPGSGDDAGKMQVREIEEQTRGVSSADVLGRIMHIDPVPTVPEAIDLRRYRALIQQQLQESPEGMELKQKLLTHFGADHVEMRTSEQMIGQEAFKRKVAAKRAEAAKLA